MRAAAAAIAILLACSLARADAEQDAEAAFRAAMSAGDAAALEELGARRPATRWTDDAWSEAARLAVRANDYPRARRALEQVIAVGTDEALVRRARAELGRISGVAGGAGEWAHVAAAHEQLVPRLHAGGDPQPALEELERLVRTQPAYPRASALMVAIASGWEREGEPARAVRWLRDARRAATTPTDELRAEAELVRTFIRSGELAAAGRELSSLVRTAPPGLVASLRHMLDRAQLRRTVRWGMWCVLAMLAAASIVALRRAAGSWRSAAKRLARPPAEAIFLVPIAAILVVVAYTGNPLVARAVLTIAIGGVSASWISGAILASVPRVTVGKLVIHVLAAMLAVAAATYLAVDRGQLIDFLLETWRAGHER